MPTDTERLDWLITQDGAEWSCGWGESTGFWFRRLGDERDPITPESDDPREAIDLAIAQE